jgi:hypothetical protein
MTLNKSHRRHIAKRGFSDEQIDQLARDGIVQSLTAEQIQQHWLEPFPRMTGNTGGALLLTFNETTRSLRPDVPPLDKDGKPSKYLYQYGGKDPKGTHTQPWHPSQPAVAATEGLFDALVATYLIGVPTAAATAPSHIGRSRFEPSVRCYFSDADVPYHHATLLETVVKQCRSQGLKLAHLPRNPAANYAYTSDKIPEECKWGAEEWCREWLDTGKDPRAELQTIVAAAREPVPYLRHIIDEYYEVGIRYPTHDHILRHFAGAIAEASSDPLQHQSLRDRLCEKCKTPKKWVDSIVEQRLKDNRDLSPEQIAEAEAALAQIRQETAAERDQSRTFEILGWNTDRNRIHYRSATTGQVATFKLGNQADLLPVAGARWIDRFYGRKDGIDWMALQGDLCEMADAAGIFNDKRKRGRGVFIDNDRVVVHLGDRLEVDGVITPIIDFKSNYIYELLPALEFDPSVEPLTDDEGRRILKLAQRCGWNQPDDHLWFAGWIVSALICGILPKRPQLQIKVHHSGGKTETLNQFVLPLLGGMAVEATGSSEAFIRQKMGSDRRPVVIDESEQGDDNGRSRQAHLKLARYAFDGVTVGRGTQGQEAVEFEMYSSFCMAGINAEIADLQTKERFFELSRTRLPEEQWRAFVRERDALITPKTGQRLLRRTIDNLQTLFLNRNLFGWIADAYGFNERQTEKVSLILACAYSLTGAAVPSRSNPTGNSLLFQNVRQWLRDNGFPSQQALLNSSTEPDLNESRKCLDHLLCHEVPWQERRDVDDLTPISSRITVSELLDVVRPSGRPVPEGTRREAEKALGRLGIKLLTWDGETGRSRLTIAIANQCEATGKVFGRSQWKNGAYTQRLMELKCEPAVVKPSKTFQFSGAGGPKRAVLLPITAVFPDADAVSDA